ncbi:ribulose-phosphate 3-epimerase, partial [Streptococcus pluranimalium]
FGGQTFFPKFLEKMSTASHLAQAKGFHFFIEVAGGVVTKTT